MSQTFHENENNMATKNRLGRTPIIGYIQHKLHISFSVFYSLRIRLCLDRHVYDTMIYQIV